MLDSRELDRDAAAAELRVGFGTCQDLMLDSRELGTDVFESIAGASKGYECPSAFNTVESTSGGHATRTPSTISIALVSAFRALNSFNR